MEKTKPIQKQKTSILKKTVTKQVEKNGTIEKEREIEIEDNVKNKIEKPKEQIRVVKTEKGFYMKGEPDLQSLKRDLGNMQIIEKSQSVKALYYKNSKCLLCRSGFEQTGKIVQICTKGHASHISCLLKRYVPKQNPSIDYYEEEEELICPNCDPNHYNMTLMDVSTLNNQMNSGLATNIKGGYFQHKNEEVYKQNGIVDNLKYNIKHKDLNFDGDVSRFMNSNKTVSNYYVKPDLDIIDLKKLTGIFSLEQMLRKNTKLKHLLDKGFMKNTTEMLKLGVNRNWIRSRLLPIGEFNRTTVKEKDKIVNLHFMEYMVRTGFTLKDFGDLGWNISNYDDFLKDGCKDGTIKKIFGNVKPNIGDYNFQDNNFNLLQDNGFPSEPTVPIEEIDFSELTNEFFNNNP